MSDEGKILYDLEGTASALNFLLALENISYRNNKSCFIKDDLSWCLENNIISEEISHHKIWNKLNISMVNYDTPIEMKIPYHPLRYDDEYITEYWDFKFKRVILKSGWKLISCECGRNMIGSFGKFIIMKHDEPQSELLDFFTNVSPDGHNQAMLDLFPLE